MTLIGALVAPRLVAKIGAKRQLVLGPILSTIGLLWMSFLSFGDSYWTHMFFPLALFGLGIGISFVPMTLTATAGVPMKEAGLASGLINTTRTGWRRSRSRGAATVAASVARDDHSSARSVAAALTSGYDRAFLIAGLLLLVGAGLALLISSNPPVASSSTAEGGETRLSQAPAPVEPAVEGVPDVVQRVGSKSAAISRRQIGISAVPVVGRWDTSTLAETGRTSASDFGRRETTRPPCSRGKARQGR